MEKLVCPSFFYIFLTLSCWKVQGNEILHTCEGPNPIQRPDCVCDLDEIVGYLSVALKMGSSIIDPSDIVKQRIQAYQCGYRTLQLPPVLTIEMTDVNYLAFPAKRLKKRRKMRVHRAKRTMELATRRKRQISLGYPTKEAWDTVIPHVPKRSGHLYVPVGSQAVLKCFGGEDASVIEHLDQTSRSFEWKLSNGLEITGRLVLLDDFNGDLKFQSVQLSDTGIYNCTVAGSSGGDEKEYNTFQVQLDVVAAPVYWLRFGVTYKAVRCRHEELLSIQRTVPSLVEKYVCSFCSVRNVSMTCVNVGETDRVVQLTLAVSAIGIEQRLPLWVSNYMNCNLECQENMHQKILNLVSDSLSKLFAIQINVIPLSGEVSEYRFLRGSLQFDLADSCPPGFFLQDSLCFPCAPGTFSPVGQVFCDPCIRGKFQPNPGSSACYRCPEGHTTLRKGSLSQMDCILEAASTAAGFLEEYWYYLLIGGIIFAVVLIIFLIVCCCGKTKLGKILRCVPCCGEKQCCKSEEDISAETQILLEEETSEQDSDSGEIVQTKAGKRRKRKKRQVIEESTDDYRPKKSNPVKRYLTKVKKNVSEISFRRKKKRESVDKEEHVEEDGNNNIEAASAEDSLEENPPPVKPPPPPPLRCTKTHGMRVAYPYHCNCPATAYNLIKQEQELSEQQGVHDYTNQDANVTVGNILNSSESFTKKLAAQRRRLEPKETPTNDLPTLPKRSRPKRAIHQGTEVEPISLLGEKNVTIRESSNVYYRDGKVKSNSNPLHVQKKKSTRHTGKNLVVTKSSSTLHNLREKTTGAGGVKSVMHTIQAKLDKQDNKSGSPQARSARSKPIAKKRTRR